MTCNQPIQYFLLASSLFDLAVKYTPRFTIILFNLRSIKFSPFRHHGKTSHRRTHFQSATFRSENSFASINPHFRTLIFGWIRLKRLLRVDVQCWRTPFSKCHLVWGLLASTYIMWSVRSAVTFRLICLPGCRRLCGLSSRVISISSARKIVCKHHRVNLPTEFYWFGEA